MVVLLIANLLWIIFDWLFEVQAVQNGLAEILPEFTAAYARDIHPNFFFIDLAFVTVFFIDFVVGWILAAVRHTHHRWYFFPFLHWYDLLGCIPVGGFRFLRLLRLVTILYRLNKSGAIDLSRTGFAKLLRKYYSVAVEEVTDRVVIRILTDVQEEVRHGGPLVERIVDDVVRPAQAQIVEWLSHRVRIAAGSAYTRYRPEIDAYIHRRVDSAVRSNTALARLSRVPMVGSTIRDTARRAMEELVRDIVHGVLQDLVSEHNKRLIDETADVLFDALVAPEEDEELNRIVTETADQVIEVVKRQVAVQQWKLQDNAGDEAELRRMLRDELAKDDESATK